MKELIRDYICIILVLIVLCYVATLLNTDPPDILNYNTVMIKDNHEKEVRMYDGGVYIENGMIVLNEARLIYVEDTSDYIE